LNCQYIGNIYGIRKSTPTKPLFYFLGGTLSCFRVVLGYHYIGAFLSQAQGDAFANPLPRPCDNGYFACQPEFHSSPLSPKNN
jgi:hypothetical protein